MRKISIMLMIVLLLCSIGIVGCHKPEATPYNEWSIVQEYVTSNYPISEEYFDSHYLLVSVNHGVDMSGEYDGRMVQLPNLTAIKFSLVIDDPQGNTYNISGIPSIFLKDSAVLTSGQPPGNTFNFHYPYYDLTQPVNELNINVSQEEALTIIKSSNDCETIEPQIISKAEAYGIDYNYKKLYWIFEGCEFLFMVDTETGELLSQDFRGLI